MCISCPNRTYTPECAIIKAPKNHPFKIGERIAALYRVGGDNILVFGDVFRKCEDLIQINPDGGHAIPGTCSSGFCFGKFSDHVMPERQYDWALQENCLPKSWRNAKIYEPNY